MRNEALCQLLESLKEEVEGWDLEGAPEDPALIRRGLYLTAMDILYAEMFEPGGYESYARLPERVLLPREDYEPLRAALDFHVRWFKSLNLALVSVTAKENGITETEALEAVISANEATFNAALELSTA